MTSVRPSMPMPPMDSVTQVGSPREELVVLRRAGKLATMRSFMTKWSIKLLGLAPR